ncbi:DNA-directed RNA polymerases I and III subunit RPAC2 [Stylophora pistillata]|uniref:DNA-directed RNA polymerases I and III subunit RPAC2 n=1 Tax=Stylophora pistillata TaxID=50429 RepID=A0A2B4SU77_STYPI|nr:DNA-directed RNA polymerases I and III subunit RPAC2 [Stylophora pistillata]
MAAGERGADTEIGGQLRRLEVMPLDSGEDETCVTPDVMFCGYSIPHPSENRINLRIQTNGIPAVEVLRRGLSELTAMCEHMLATFETAVEEYKDAQHLDISP